MNAEVHLVYYTGPYTSTLLPDAQSIVARAHPSRRERFAQRVESQRPLDVASLRVLELSMAAARQGDFRLSEIEYPSEAGVSAKPHWRQGKPDFSLTHSSGIAACAVGAGCRVGVDAERMRSSNPRTVARLLAPQASLALGLNEQNALSRWTQIEAVLKGAGLGIMHGREIEWRDDAVWLRGERWYVHAVDCGAAYVMHVAVDAAECRFAIQRLVDI